MNKNYLITTIALTIVILSSIFAVTYLFITGYGKTTYSVKYVKKYHSVKTYISTDYDVSYNGLFKNTLSFNNPFNEKELKQQISNFISQNYGLDPEKIYFLNHSDNSVLFAVVAMPFNNDNIYIRICKTIQL